MELLGVDQKYWVEGHCLCELKIQGGGRKAYDFGAEIKIFNEEGPHLKLLNQALLYSF